jgi:Arc/MetJ-type ribon-helix-helix transcriptional regulator
MYIELSDEINQLVHGIYAEGHYASEAEVVAVAVRMLHRQQQLCKDLEQGCRELDRGERIDADEVFSELRQRAADLDRTG